MDEETKAAIDSINQRLDSIDGIFTDFHTLLNNHMGDFSAKFGRLKQSVDDAIAATKDLNTVRDQALNTKIDSYRWALRFIAIITAIAVGGLVTLSVWAVWRVIGG